MLLEIGPCHRRYAIHDFYEKATEHLAVDVELDDDFDLKGYKAGLPFPPETIDPDDSRAGAMWAWNLQKRFRGAGHTGRFRITAIPAKAGSIVRYRGDFFLFQAQGRADLADTDYRWAESNDVLWSTGGYFAEPFSARELAWRQFRVAKSLRKWREPDDIFVYVPSMRKMRRSGTSWVDGFFAPRFSVAGRAAGGGAVLFGNSAAVSPGAGASAAASEDARMGFTGIFLRPNAYNWRIRGERTVIAPINGAKSGYPLVEDRNYGYSGLAVGNDRWDVRHAVVIEGALRAKNETIRTVTIYVDYQTLQPLYWISRTDKRRLVEVGVLVHRFTGDVEEYPPWSDGKPTYVFEPVAASFFDALAGKGGWLRESYDLRSIPFDESDRKRMMTSHALQRGH